MVQQHQRKAELDLTVNLDKKHTNDQSASQNFETIHAKKNQIVSLKIFAPQKINTYIRWFNRRPTKGLQKFIAKQECF